MQVQILCAGYTHVSKFKLSMQASSKTIDLQTRVTDALKWGYKFTSIAGVTQVRDTNCLKSRFAWLLLTILGGGLTYWIVVKSVKTYFNFESVTTIDVQNQQAIDFPSVTVCSQNRVHCRHLYELIKKCTEVSISYTL